MSHYYTPPGFGHCNKPRDWLNPELDRMLHVAQDVVCPTKHAVDFRAVAPGEKNCVVPGSQIIREMFINPVDHARTPTGRYFRVVVYDVRERSFERFRQNFVFARRAGFKTAREMAEVAQEMYQRTRSRDGALAFPNGLQDHHRIVTCTITPARPSCYEEWVAAYERFYGRLPFKNREKVRVSYAILDRPHETMM